METKTRKGNIPPQMHHMKNQIVITSHAKQRWFERVPEEERRGKKLKNVAFKARYYGVNLNCFDKEEVGSEKLHNYLIDAFKFKYESNVLRYWEGYVYIFAGKHGRTLISIVKANVNLENEQLKKENNMELVESILN